MYTKEAIQNYVIMENFLSKFINDNAQKIIDSLLPFVGKKLRTQTGFVAKYIKPEITEPILTNEMLNIGITKIIAQLSFDVYSTSMNAKIRFSIYGTQESLFGYKYQYQNPYRSSYIDASFLTISNNDLTLVKIDNFNPIPALNSEQVIQEYQTAVQLKEQYKTAASKVNYRLRTDIN